MAELKNYLDKLGLGAFLTQLKKIFAPISHTHTKSEVGLENVDNTADANKSVKYATNAGAAEKVNGHTVASDVPANAKFTDTTYTNFVKSGSSAKAGLVPAPSTTAGTSKYLREDGTWTTPPNTTYTDMKGATASAAGTHGLVPAPASGNHGKYLRGDGTWQTPTNTTYNDATQTSHGLMSTADKTKLDGIDSGANKTVVDSTMSDTSENPVQNKIIKSELDKKSNTDHTHTIVNGHTVESNVPANAKFTDTVYTHPTTSGNKHIPSGGSSGQILRWSADGTASWGADNNTDTKVTSVGNHYTPSGGTTTSASGGTLTDITNSSSGVQVVTGVTKDAAGHVTGVTSVALKSVNTNTTYSNFVKSGSGAKAGLVPAPSTTAGTTKYLREDGTWTVPPNTNTWTAFKGATSSAAGTAGYVPAPDKGAQDKFFKADGTWALPVEFMTDTEFNTLIADL